MEIEDVVRRFTDNLKKDLDKRVEDVMRFRNEIDKKMKELEEYLKEVLRTALPVNLLDILSKGGFVRSWLVDVRSRAYVEVRVNDRILEMTPMSEYGTLPLDDGKYRITLIIEKIEKI